MKHYKVDYTLEGESLSMKVQATNREEARTAFRGILRSKIGEWADKSLILIVSVSEMF